MKQYGTVTRKHKVSGRTQEMSATQYNLLPKAEQKDWEQVKPEALEKLKETEAEKTAPNTEEVEELRFQYRTVTGEKPGNKTAEEMRSGILAKQSSTIADATKSVSGTPNGGITGLSGTDAPEQDGASEGGESDEKEELENGAPKVTEGENKETAEKATAALNPDAASTGEDGKPAEPKSNRIKLNQQS